MGEGRKRRKRVALFGNFGSSNFGNEAQLQAMLYHLRRFWPDAEVTCICSNPRLAAATYHVRAVPLAGPRVRSWTPRSAPARLLREVCRVGVGVTVEPYSWLKGLLTVRRMDMLIIPGTGLLTDAYGLFGEGPYTLLKWTLIAKACRCKVLFLSVGAGPLHRAIGRRLVKLALSLADVRSYRDRSTKRYLESVGIQTDGDLVLPDLAFSLPEASLPKREFNDGRPIVGLGLMESPGRYSGTSDETHRAYIEALVAFAGWLIGRGYGVRVLVGDYSTDLQTKQEFGDLLRERTPGAEEHVVDDPISSVDELLSQIASTNLVVATRFHGVLLALLCGTPAICISVHEKSDALMSAMGLTEYCLHMNSLTADELIETFRRLERGATELQPLIRDRASAFRSALDEQYVRIFGRDSGRLTPVVGSAAEDEATRGTKLQGTGFELRP
jgi:polysaccharide pyruvyl transferase WcaK-like protein